MGFYRKLVFLTYVKLKIKLPPFTLCWLHLMRAVCPLAMPTKTPHSISRQTETASFWLLRKCSRNTRADGMYKSKGETRPTKTRARCWGDPHRAGEGRERLGRRVVMLFRNSCLPFCSHFNNLWCSVGPLPDLIKIRVLF